MVIPLFSQAQQENKLSLSEQVVIDYAAEQLSEFKCPDFTSTNPLFPQRASKNTINAFSVFLSTPNHLEILEKEIRGHQVGTPKSPDLRITKFRRYRCPCWDIEAEVQGDSSLKYIFEIKHDRPSKFLMTVTTINENGSQVVSNPITCFRDPSTKPK